MSKFRHPLRDMALHVFERTDGKQWLAHFATLKIAPLTFRDTTKKAVIARAEEWRAKVIEENEASAAKRAAGLEKARLSRLAKKDQSA